MSAKPALFDFAGQKAHAAALLRDTPWDEVAAFIGPNADKFRPTWEEMRASAEAGKYRLPWGFCWPALFLGFAWFFYRRMWAVGAFVLVAPVIVSLLFDSAPGSLGAMIAIAMFARSFYVQHALRRIGAVKAAGGDRAAIAQAGGVSIPGAIVGGALLLLGLAGTVASLLLPPPA